MGEERNWSKTEGMKDGFKHRKGEKTERKEEVSDIKEGWSRRKGIKRKTEGRIEARGGLKD